MESLYKDRDVRRFIRAGGFFAVCMIITGAFYIMCIWRI